MDNFLIPPEKILDGINLALRYSLSLLNSSGNLYNQKKYQQSIPLAILSYEEAAKANWLLIHLQEEKGITREDWKSLRDHKFKLVQLENYNLKKINNMSDAEMKIYLNFQNETIADIAEKSKEHAIKKREELLEILDKFEKVKEICFYSNWDLSEKKWKSFHMLHEEDQYAMNYSILNLAQNLIARVIFMKELHENPSKPTGIKDVIADVEKNEIIVLEDHKEDIEKRKSYQDIKSNLEESKKNEPLVAKGFIAFRKYF